MTSGIDNEEWERLSPLLDQALELAPDALEPWLSRLAAERPELADSLRDLLVEKSKVEASRFLEDSPAVPLEPATLAGQRFGAFEIEMRIGQGGMGSVWLAHRCDGRYEGKAAVKLLNTALIGGPAEQRFIREGSVLAGLQHPGIAHLLDAGVSPAGQPYLILEHVLGSSIDEYCEERRLGIRQRVRVFLAVLEAVAYAHRHLVVHRDIKPSNILVTAEGAVKLLDFGVATLLEPASEAQTSHQYTREIGAALTPAFAAPEQLLGQTVTTASDIFALGRVLYVLLGGRHAAMPQDQTAAELVRNTLEREPPLVSEMAAEPGVKRLLRGDLDNIVGKALRSEPMQRYSTAEAFADDLKRYLASEPVSARPDSLRYRVGKFVRRHRGGVLSGALTALMLVLVTGFALVQMLDARQQRDSAQVARQRAEGLNAAMTSLLSQSGPDGEPLRPQELLERAIGEVEARYADDPAFLVHMLLMISGRYLDLQDTNNEYATLVKAENVARTSGDPYLILQVQCNTVETELAAGRKAQAATRLDEGVSLLESLRDVPPADRANCLRARSELARADGDISAAIQHLEEARAVLEQDRNTDGNVYGGLLSALAAYYDQAGDLITAHAYSLKLVDLDQRLGRQDSTAGMIARINLASSFREMGQLRQAHRLHLEAGSDRTTSPAVKVFYGEVIAQLGTADASVELIAGAMPEIDSSGHQRLRIRARLALTASLLLASRLDEATATLNEATSLMQGDDIGNAYVLVESHLLRARILGARKEHDEAAREVAAALERHATGDLSELLMARVLLVQAHLRLAQERPLEAAASAQSSAQIFERTTVDPAQSADVGEALLALAQSEAAMGSSAAALAVYERANTSLRNGLGADHPRTLLAERLAAGLRQPDST